VPDQIMLWWPGSLGIDLSILEGTVMRMCKRVCVWTHRGGVCVWQHRSALTETRAQTLHLTAWSEGMQQAHEHPQCQKNRRSQAQPQVPEASAQKAARNPAAVLLMRPWAVRSNLRRIQQKRGKEHRAPVLERHTGVRTLNGQVPASRGQAQRGAHPNQQHQRGQLILPCLYCGDIT
jgi:hypothetical protein